MYNVISYNQLASGWKQDVNGLIDSLDRTSDESDILNDYYDCLIECDEDRAVMCKRICRRILS